MSSDAAEVDARIGAAVAAAAEHEPGSVEHRAARVSLAAALAARFIQHGGSADDGLRAERIAQEVLADDAATAEQRQSMSMLLPTLAMMRITPASALRGLGPGLDAEALRRTEQWRAGTDDRTLVAGLEHLLGQFAAIEDAGNLPPQIRSNIAMMKAAMGLMSDVARPEWSGTVAPDVARELREAVAEAPPGVPGTELMRGLVVWVDGFDRADERAERVAELEKAITDLPEDSLLVPVLQYDLAIALVRSSDLGGVRAVERVTALLEQAVNGMPEDHPLHAETVRMLAGALVATAAETSGVADRERAAQLAAQVLAADPGAPENLFLSSLVALLPGRARDVPGALRDLVECVEQLPGGHPLRAVALGQFGAVLADRSLVAGLLKDGTEAMALLERAIAAADPDGDVGSVLAAIRGIVGVNAAMRRGDDAALPGAAAALRVARDGMSLAHPLRPNVELVLVVAELRIAAVTGTGLRAAVATVRAVVDGPAPSGMPPSTKRTLSDAVDALAGLLDGDPEAVLAAADKMEEALVAPGDGAHPLQRPAQLVLLGKALLAAIGTGQAQEGTARRAADHLSEARNLLGPDAGVPTAEVLRDLAMALRAAGERAESRRVAVEALEHHASVVLLQADATDAIIAAQGASGDATQVARWCLADGDLDGAVAAVELGRGLVLHATTSVSHVAATLDAFGRPDLAELWRGEHFGEPATGWAVEAARGELGPQRVADLRAAAGLRGQVVAALRAAPEAAMLFRAPTTRATGEALRELGADVLVYLVAGGSETPGQLLVVDRAGGVAAFDAAELRDVPTGPLATYLALPGPDREGFIPSAWRPALERLCDWAGQAVLAPLLAALAGRAGSGPDGVPRVVLVPCGTLGAVPWAAARRPTSAAPRYACADLVLSSAASARQIVDVASRQAAVADVLLVAGPLADRADDADAGNELATLRRTTYPQATVLGPVEGADGPGTPEGLLARLPGSGATSPSVVHLACHAAAGDEPELSVIDLSEPLTVARVLAQGTGQAGDEPGPLVVLAACETALTRSSHDEALTVATAFLAAGAAGVVGSLWKVNNRYTSVLMVVFHHFLHTEGLPAADALRRTQLWALDPAHPTVEELLCSRSDAGDATSLPEWFRSRLPTRSNVAMWAAFTHHGR